jgi:hypothetical protein
VYRLRQRFFLAACYGPGGGGVVIVVPPLKQSGQSNCTVETSICKKQIVSSVIIRGDPSVQNADKFAVPDDVTMPAV